MSESAHQSSMNLEPTPKTPPGLTRNHWILTGFTVCYILLWFFVDLRHSVPIPGWETDGVDYLLKTRDLQAGHFAPPKFGTTAYYIFAVAAVGKIIPDLFLAAKLLSGIAGAIFLLSSIELGRIISNRAAILTGILVLVNPYFIFYSDACMADMPAAGLAAAALCLALKAHPSETGASLFFGLAWGMRSITVFFLPVLFIRSGNWLRRAGFFLVAALPQLIVNFYYFGNPVYSENWRNLAGLVRPIREVERMNSIKDIPLSDLLRTIPVWIRRLSADLPDQSFHMVYWIAPFIFVGVPILWNRKGRVWILCACLYLAAIEGVWLVPERYFLPALPIMLVAGIAGMERLCSHRRWILRIATALVVITTAGAGVSKTNEFLGAGSIEFRRAGEYVHSHSVSSDQVVVSSLPVLYYAERAGWLLESLTDQDIDNLESVLAAHSVRYVVADTRIHQERPALEFLNDPAAVRIRYPGWKQLRFGGNFNVIVWEIPGPRKTE